MPTYAVTGARPAGPPGDRAVLDSGVPAAEIAAIVRSPEKAADLATRRVEIRKGSCDDRRRCRRRGRHTPPCCSSPATLPVSASRSTAVIDAAKLAGVERLIYTSILKADTTANPLAPEHKATEEVLAASGLPYTVLRNSWYTENYTDQLPQYLASGTILGATGGSKISAATRADYAVAAAAALAREEDGDAVYELGSSRSPSTSWPRPSRR